MKQLISYGLILLTMLVSCGRNSSPTPPVDPPPPPTPTDYVGSFSVVPSTLTAWYNGSIIFTYSANPGVKFSRNGVDRPNPDTLKNITEGMKIPFLASITVDGKVYSKSLEVAIGVHSKEITDLIKNKSGNPDKGWRINYIAIQKFSPVLGPLQVQSNGCDKITHYLENKADYQYGPCSSSPGYIVPFKYTLTNNGKTYIQETIPTNTNYDVTRLDAGHFDLYRKLKASNSVDSFYEWTQYIPVE